MQYAHSMNEDKLVLTLSKEAARETRRMAEYYECTAPELVRRALSLMQLYQELGEDEYLAVHGKKGERWRIRPVWTPQPAPDTAEAVEKRIQL